MSGSDVSDPCPISAAGDMIATVSSVEIVTHGLSATSPLRAASARRPDAIVKVKPAAVRKELYLCARVHHLDGDREPLSSGHGFSDFAETCRLPS